MKKYATPFAEIFGMSCEDVQTAGLADFFRASGDAQTISFLESFRVNNKGTGGADEIGFGDLK